MLLPQVARRFLRTTTAYQRHTVAILGGSFDPPTLAHLQLIETTINLFKRCEGSSQELMIDEVRAVPCGLRPDKLDRTLPTKRFEMLQLAIGDYFPSDYPVQVDPIEVENGASIPTYSMLQDLQNKEPDTEFWFIMGDDLLDEIDQWEGGESLLKETKFIIFDRNGTSPGHKNWPSIFKRASTDFQTISSTEVRNRVKLTKPITDLVTPSVNNYILNQGLYLKE